MAPTRRAAVAKAPTASPAAGAHPGRNVSPGWSWVRATVDGWTDDKAYWWPSTTISYAPIFCFPPRVLDFLNWLLGVPGYLFGWNTVYFAITYVSWAYLQPDIDAFKGDGWQRAALLMLARNMALIWLFAGSQHWLFYQRKAVGSIQKYNPEWQTENDPRFFLSDQVYENVALSCLSGVPIWTATEVGFYWAWGTGRLPMPIATWPWVTDSTSGTAAGLPWWWNLAWLAVIPLWRELHFYAIHRLIHYQPLYKLVHRVHHKNFNPGPWSGLAMHPVEHLLYFSVVLIHVVVPSHPLHVLFNAQHTALTPALGHSGFHGPYLNGWIPGGSYFHYLHHKYLECNYGESTLPLDWLFGTFRAEGAEKAGKGEVEE